MTVTLLRGGTLFDGVSPQRRLASVLVVDGLIARVDEHIPASKVDKIIDVGGAWVTPGFIDAHSHADVAVLTGEQMESRVQSGVTTEIVGQDGLGLAHARGMARDQMIEMLTPVAGNIGNLLFDDVADYLRAVNRGAYSRVASLSPHGTIRASVAGRSLRPVTDDEMVRMADAFANDLRAGSLGLSTGLSYPPASASDTAEIVTLLSAGGPETVYVTHLRSYGKDFNRALLEALEITRISRCHLHLSHFHVSGPAREGMARLYLEQVEEASPTATLDSYPYPHGCTFLTSLLPDRLQHLAYEELRVIAGRSTGWFLQEIARMGPGETISVGWEGLIVAGLKGNQGKWNGLSLGQIGSRTHQMPEEIVLKIISEQIRSPMVLVPQGITENINQVASSPMQVVGSDGIFGSGGPHPRISGTFMRFLHLAMTESIDTSVEQAVAKMTSKTAKIFGLTLGAIRRGYPADLLVLDPSRITPGDDVVNSTPSAVQHAFIGGSQTVQNGVWRERKLPNMALRRGQ